VRRDIFYTESQRAYFSIVADGNVSYQFCSGIYDDPIAKVGHLHVFFPDTFASERYAVVDSRIPADMRGTAYSYIGRVRQKQSRADNSVF